MDVPDQDLRGRNAVLLQSILCYVKCSTSIISDTSIRTHEPVPRLSLKALGQASAVVASAQMDSPSTVLPWC